MTPPSRGPEDVERDIEATRDRIETNLDELRSRLQPGALGAQALRSLKSTEERAMDKITDTTSTVADKTRDASASLIDTAREHPLTTGLVALGIGLLAAGTAVVRSSDGAADHDDVDEAWQRARARAEEAGTRAQLTTQHTAEKARHKAKRSANGVAHWVTHHPVQAGAIAAVGGVAVGLLVGSTKVEDDLLGDSRRRMVESVKETAQDTAAAARAGVERAGETLRHEADERDLTPEGARKRMEGVGHDAVETAREIARESREEGVKAAEEEAKRRGLTSSSHDKEAGHDDHGKKAQHSQHDKGDARDKAGAHLKS